MYLQLSSVWISSPPREGQGEPGPRDVNLASVLRAEAHLDPGVFHVVEGHVPERVRVEIGSEPIVEDLKHVAVESGGHSGRVVVGRVQTASRP